MSHKHPVISVTGSSGAGTSTAKVALEHIFRRENITPAIVEGDCFHKFGRIEFKEKAKEFEAAGKSMVRVLAVSDDDAAANSGNAAESGMRRSLHNSFLQENPLPCLNKNLTFTFRY